VHLNNTELKNRTLWYDGDSTLDSSKLSQFIQLGKSLVGIFTDEITDDIKQFNKLVSPQEQIRVKESVNPLDFSWNIPSEYQNINLIDYLAEQLDIRCDNLTEQQWNDRAIRISTELSLYEKLDLTNVLRTIIYIINTLDSQNIVWGVGRGSSVSSFVLFLIGVHDVDSVLYELNIDDFLRID
jgi:DNA polymerase III alpha subunit